MEESILLSIKEGLGITSDYTPFDNQIIMHINSVFMILNRMGVGPDKTFMIEDKANAWSEFLSPDEWEGEYFNLVKTYMVMKVKMMWDPPTTSTLADVYNRQIEEFEYTLNLQSELIKYKKFKKEETNNGD